MTVRLGNGDGTFGGPVTVAVGDNPQSLALADVNRDGRLDLATSDLEAATVSLLLGNGDGTFAAATSWTVGTGPAGVALPDLNGDGRPDLVTATP